MTSDAADVAVVGLGAMGAMSAWRLAARGARVLLGDPGRGFSPTFGLLELARYPVPTEPDVEGVALRRPAVWQVLGAM